MSELRAEIKVAIKNFATGKPLVSFAHDFLRANLRSSIQLNHDDWKKLPIPDVPPEKQAPIVALVERILAAKKQNNVGANGIRPDAEIIRKSKAGACHAPLHEPQTDITTLEAEIDRIVYQLYNLTDDEIAVVEGKR